MVAVERMCPMRTMTAGQLVAMIRLIGEQQIPTEQAQKLIDGGYLADLCNANFDEINRDDFRRHCELNPLDEHKCADPIICVDRSKRPIYPNWVEEAYYVPLQKTGPTDFDFRKLEQYLLPNQETCSVTGNIIFEHIKTTDTIKIHLGLCDLREIKRRGSSFFQKHFKNKSIFAWKSVVRSRDGCFYVPYLCEVGLYWHLLSEVVNPNCPVMRFVSNSFF